MASHSRLYQSTSTMECEINELSYHVDASHKQACTDLEKASQFITDALQNEFQQNLAVRMLIHRLEDRAAENGRRLSEQVESNRQLKLQVDELQKQLQNKDKSLAQAKQSNAILRNELRELQQQLQLHRHQDGHRTIQEVAEWLQDGDSQPNAVKEEGDVLQIRVVGIKEENNADDGYQKYQSDETAIPTEHANSSSADIKAELLQEADEASPDPVKPLRLAVQLVDSSVDQHQQATTSKDNKNGEQYNTGRGSQLQPSAVPNFTAIPETEMDDRRPYKCGKAAIEKHQQDIHTGDHKPHLDQKQHIRTGETPYICQHCGKRFADANIFRRHECIHNEASKSYHCRQCNKWFSQSVGLKIHQRIHTGEKPYQCGQCGKRFTQVGNLRTHQLIHTGERPHTCRQCGKSFSQAVTLRKHNLIHTGEKPYQCAHCGKCFRALATLNKHKHTVHTAETIYQCPECDRRFSQLAKLRRHLRTHTGDKSTLLQL